MFVLPEGLPIELTPLAFLVGKWAGTGIISLDGVEHEFSQQVEFAHDGSVLTYISSAKLNDESGTALPSELGYWRIARDREAFDYGPGLLPGKGETKFTTQESLEPLRRKEDGFHIEVTTIHPGGVAELYSGVVRQARIDLESAGCVGFKRAKTYSSSSRMYGLVEGALLWVWDITMNEGDEPQSHASARLERVS